jgi:hypothetical protein
MANQQIANPQIFTKYSTSQSQNTLGLLEVVTVNVFYVLYKIKLDRHMLYLLGEKYVFADQVTKNIGIFEVR